MKLSIKNLEIVNYKFGLSKFKLNLRFWYKQVREHEVYLFFDWTERKLIINLFLIMLDIVVI